MIPPIWGQQAAQWLKLDCRNYRGDRPCSAGIDGVCPKECAAYEPLGHRILIIKLGALGDVIRTAALLPGLKAAYPSSQITWISRAGGVRVLSNHPLIDRLLPFDAETICHIEHERFDLCLSLDKEPGPTALAMRVDAADKRGIGLSPHGTTFPLNSECVHYFQLGLCNDLKFNHNEQSYQQLIYSALGLEYRGERYRLHPGQAEQMRAKAVWRSLHINDGDVVIGLNTGAGRVFANKNWPPDKFVALAHHLTLRPGWRVALLGGPDERELNKRIATDCPGVVNTGCGHTELEFAALLWRCDTIVTGDTMAMHVAIAGDVPTVVLFGPTCAPEIDLFGRGEQIVTALPCSPCYLRRCDKVPNCMDDISVTRVLTAVDHWATAKANARTSALPAEVPA